MNKINQEKIWEHFQTDELNVFSGAHPRLSFLAKQVAKGARVLNIGVGDGFLESQVLNHGAEAYSLDPSENTIKKLAAHLGDADGEHFKAGYVESIPFPDSFFDVVIMSEVLEHLSDKSLSEALQEVHRVLKPGGKFIGTVPADEDLSENSILCPCCEARFHRWGHEQSFSKQRFVEVLENNFVNVVVRRAYFVNWKQCSWKGKIVAFAKLSVCVLGNGGAGENWQFSVRKGEH
ncbi:class I SAM-dependent methyltransferase [Mariprofundus sp. NF]|uniref:class I SAM-dependent methyltransferase n=1 Tax=Mariprofundus sp. NF TaxID=2608716 RepID=UPI0015A3A69E|nr:class I SAM-dependent methyltransferase [Mariprofundus sp. NF]NWF39500.1 class I SAM-dependent methyltransferase [Mariprofundus sp. NF]